MSDEAPCPADDCDFVAKNEFGLGAHVRAKHDPDKPAPAPAPAPESRPAPDGGPRRFRCKRYPKQVLAPHGKTIARFENGELVTEDPKVVELCESLDYVEAVS